MSAHLSPIQHDVYVLTKVRIHSAMSLRNVPNVAFVNVYFLTKARMHSTTSLRYVPNAAFATVPRRWPFLKEGRRPLPLLSPWGKKKTVAVRVLPRKGRNAVH